MPIIPAVRTIVRLPRDKLNLLNREEVVEVLAHEPAHVKNRNILIGSIAATVTGLSWKKKRSTATRLKRSWSRERGDGRT